MTSRPTAASRQVSEEDEIAKIKKQNKSQEAASSGAAAAVATPTETQRKESSVPSTPVTNDRPRYSVDNSSQPSRSPAPSRQTSTVDQKKNESESGSATPATETAEEARARRRSGYLGGSNDNSSSSAAPETNGRDREFSCASYIMCNQIYSLLFLVIIMRPTKHIFFMSSNKIIERSLNKVKTNEEGTGL